VAAFLNLEKNPSFSLSFPSVLFVFEFSSSLLVDSGSFGYQNSIVILDIVQKVITVCLIFPLLAQVLSIITYLSKFHIPPFIFLHQFEV
jgi:hypothetical protein